MGSAMQDQLLHITNEIERQVDATIEKMDNMDVGDLENLRKARVKELKEREEKKKHWLELGHGTYEQLPEEKMFFDVIKKSENVIVHFFTDTSQKSPIMDMHLKKLAPQHLETRFVKFNAEKCPFLTEKLKIKTIPTLALVKNGVMVDKVVGFTQLGNRDDFSTDMLEWRVAHSEVIEYEGDLSVPPHLQQKVHKNSNRKIRDGAFNNDDDDDLDELTSLDVKHDFNAGSGGNGVGREKLVERAAELTAEEAAELGLNDDE